MIPIGTRCVIVTDGRQPATCQEFIGDICTVIGYHVYAANRLRGSDHVIFVAGEERAARGSQLLPIGHDPDAETREQKCEVEA